MRLRPHSVADWNRVLRTREGSALEELFRPLQERGPLLVPPRADLEERLSVACRGIGCRSGMLATIAAPKAARAFESLRAALPGSLADHMDNQVAVSTGGWQGASLAKALGHSGVSALAAELAAGRGVADAAEAEGAAYAELSCCGEWHGMQWPLAYRNWAHGLRSQANWSLLAMLAHVMVFRDVGGTDGREGEELVRPFLELYLQGNYPVGWVTLPYGEHVLLVVTG